MPERPHSREDFTYLEIYRPVIGGAGEFLDEVKSIGQEMYGSKFSGLRTEVRLEQGEDGELEPVMSTVPVETSRALVYPETSLRLDLLDRRVPPQMNYASRFRWAASRLIKKPGDTVYRPIERSELEAKRRLNEKTRQSLAYKFEEIADDFGIYDLEHLELPFKAIAIPVDPPLEHTGLELSLLPDPSSPVTRMLVQQAGLCLRGLGLKSSKAAFPYSPTTLSVPFVRLPRDSSNINDERFIQEIQELLPLRLILGGFKDNVAGASWQPRR